jgi:hypothetical protein
LWDKKTFDDHRSANSLTYYATGDLNGDHQADHVILLANNNGGYAIWVLISSKQGWKKVELPYDLTNKVSYVLGILRPGLYNYKVSDLPKHNLKEVKYDAVKITYLGGDINIAYWDDKKFDGFVLEDMQL